MPRMRWIGLTGGIATGKSTIARLFESREYEVVDADQISHDITRLGERGYLQILSHFGTDILLDNQQLDRKKLGEIIFRDAHQRLQLENILHPLIQKKVSDLRKQHETDGLRYCFYDVPLLFEKKLQSQFDFIVTAWCPLEQQLQRLMARNKLSIEAASERVAAQFPIIDKVAGSHFCMDNSGSESDLILLANHFCDQLDLNMI